MPALPVRSRASGQTGRRVVTLVAVVVAAAAARAELPAGRLDQLAEDAIRATDSFRPVGDDALEAAARGLRGALGPLDVLLGRSRSGPDWRKWLDWRALEEQAAAGSAADPRLLRRLEERLGATETGLDMPEFARVRRAVTRYAEAADAARGDGSSRLSQRLTTLSSALLSAAATGSAEMLAPVPPILERLSEAGQSADLVSAVRGTMSRPNILIEVHERLLATAVDRPVDQVTPVDETVLGTRVRGSGRTTGSVRLDFVPSPDRAAFDIVLAGRNVAHTRGSQGPVTVHSRGVTDISARRRVFLDEHVAAASPVQAAASTSTQVTGIGVNRRFGQRLIRKIASRRVAEMRPQAEAIAEQRARERVRRQFEEQTAPALGQFEEQFRTRVRQPLEARGLYPEMLHMNTTDSALLITARKALAAQVAAASGPPPAAAGSVVTARVHESAANNVLEEKFGGRIFTHEDVERIARDFDAKPPEALDNEEEQKPWAVTFAKYRPITVSAADDRVKLMLRGDKFVSGERSFPGMDVWVTYAMACGPGGRLLVREGDVQIYPPGFKPGGGEKMSMQETSLRRILQKRFDKVFKSEIEIPAELPLKGEMAAVGPLCMNQLESRRDGWIVAGWRQGGGVLVR